MYVKVCRGVSAGTSNWVEPTSTSCTEKIRDEGTGPQCTRKVVLCVFPIKKNMRISSTWFYLIVPFLQFVAWTSANNSSTDTDPENLPPNPSNPDRVVCLWANMSSVEATAAWGLSNTNGFSKDHEDLNYQLALGWTNPRYPIFFVRYPINILHIAILSPSCPTIYHYIPILNRLVLSQLFEKKHTLSWHSENHQI